MKKIFLLLIGIFLFQLSEAQSVKDSLRRLSDYDLGTHYLKQSKQQRTIGWVLIGGGITLSVIGTNRMMNDLFSKSTGGEILFLLGNTSMIASIPVFLAASKNKGRAEILLRSQNVPMTLKTGSKMVSVGLAIPLTR